MTSFWILVFYKSKKKNFLLHFPLLSLSSFSFFKALLSKLPDGDRPSLWLPSLIVDHQSPVVGDQKVKKGPKKLLYSPELWSSLPFVRNCPDRRRSGFENFCFSSFFLFFFCKSKIDLIFFVLTGSFSTEVPPYGEDCLSLLLFFCFGRLCG